MKLSDARRETEIARTTIRDLEQTLSESRARIDEIQGKLSNSVPRNELESQE
jgi:predicted  nucleic acid-binding Zn-ribbon protein